MEIDLNSFEVIHLFMYLDKYYYVNNDVYYCKYKDIQYWGSEICEHIPDIFCLTIEFTKVVFKQWSHNNGVVNFELAWGVKTLNAKFRPHLGIELSNYGIKDIQYQVNLTIFNELSKEIDAKPLKHLLNRIKTIDELISIIKCLGYQINELKYDPYDPLPYMSFTSIKLKEIYNEQQNNIHWENWVRSEG